MNLVFFGSGAFGLPTLRDLSRSHTITGVVSQPDRKAGRGGRLTPTPIAAWAAEHLPQVPLLKPERASKDPDRARVHALAADAWVVIAFGQLLRPGLLEDRFAINLHASLLPRWRGAAPINAAMLAGDSETGNSVITLAERMDAGDVLGRSARPIDPAQTAGELHDELAQDGPDLVERVLQRHAAAALEPAPQDETRVTIAPKLTKADGWVDFADTAAVCRRRVHGLTPWPGVTAIHRGEPLKLLRVRDEEPAPSPTPGTFIDDDGLVACGGGSALRLLEVQPPGKRAMAWDDYARGRVVRAGEIISGTRPGGGPA